jgi:pentapeptide MXKDX repeat protein
MKTRSVFMSFVFSSLVLCPAGRMTKDHPTTVSMTKDEMTKDEMTKDEVTKD